MLKDIVVYQHSMCMDSSIVTFCNWQVEILLMHRLPKYCPTLFGMIPSVPIIIGTTTDCSCHNLSISVFRSWSFMIFVFNSTIPWHCHINYLHFLSTTVKSDVLRIKTLSVCIQKSHNILNIFYYIFNYMFPPIFYYWHMIFLQGVPVNHLGTVLCSWYLVCVIFLHELDILLLFFLLFVAQFAL